MASGEIMIEGLPMDEKNRIFNAIGVHPAISELFFNTHHDYNPSNPEAGTNKGYFNLAEEAKDFLRSLKELKIRQAYHLTPLMLINDFLPKI